MFSVILPTMSQEHLHIIPLSFFSFPLQIPSMFFSIFSAVALKPLPSP